MQQEITIRSPGRINVIGEHVDYNDGFVLPACIDRFVSLKVRLNGSKSEVGLYAEDFEQTARFDLNFIQKHQLGWPNYLIGVISEFQKLGLVFSGFDVSFSSTIPIGAGLSSSAALECGLAFALNELFDLGFDRLSLAKLAQKAEQDFVGVQCGIMDQFTCMLGEKDHLIYLDCKDLTFEMIPFDFKDYRFVLLDSRVSHELADSKYNERRNESEEALSLLSDTLGVTSFREVSAELLKQNKNILSDIQYKRSRHIISEINRTKLAVKAIRDGNPDQLGALMFASHKSLQHDYQVCCEETNHLVEMARATKLSLGSRQVGGGFGGSTINLIRSLDIPQFVKQMSRGYLQATGKQLKSFPVEIEKGTHKVAI